jgi:hypothetical protein
MLADSVAAGPVKEVMSPTVTVEGVTPGELDVDAPAAAVLGVVEPAAVAVLAVVDVLLAWCELLEQAAATIASAADATTIFVRPDSTLGSPHLVPSAGHAVLP